MLETVGSHTLLNGECLGIMSCLPDASVDMILCDLPYGTTQCAWDSVIAFENPWFEYFRLVKPNAAIVLTAAQPFTTKLIASQIENFKYSWVWNKNRPSGFAQAKNKPLKTHEDICVFSKGVTVHANQSDKRMPYNPQGLEPFGKVMVNGASERESAFGKRPSHNKTYMQEFTNYPRDVLDFDCVDGAVHPTQKPVSLMEYLIRTYSDEGDTVLDNTMGSGTTGVACANTNRKFIGIEQDKKYFDIAVERIRGATE